MDFGKWSNLYINTRNCIIFSLTTSQSQKLIPKEDLKWDCPYFYSNFFFEEFWSTWNGWTDQVSQKWIEGDFYFHFRGMSSFYFCGTWSVHPFHRHFLYLVQPFAILQYFILNILHWTVLPSTALSCTAEYFTNLLNQISAVISIPIQSWHQQFLICRKVLGLGLFLPYLVYWL